MKKIENKSINYIFLILSDATKSFEEPLVDTIIKEFGKDPYIILISCLLSLRAKDTTTVHVCRELFSRVTTPQKIIAMSRSELEKIVYKTGYYKTKARVLQEVSQVLLDRFGGKVPQTAEELLSIKGIGIKTAHLVMGLAFDELYICVDTHVHRISNRLGLIKTKNAEQSEGALRGVLPKKYWTIWNKLLVMWGQNVCTPISPKCSQCPINHLCKRIGVTKSR
jgi:endonuclease-3